VTIPRSPEEARLLHDEIVVFDLHADTPKLMHRLAYDLAARHERRRPRQASYFGHVDLPRMRDGGLAAQVFGLWTFPYPERGCARSVHAQLDALDRAVDKNPEQIERCLSGDDVRRAHRAGRVAALAGIEGGQAIEGSLAHLAGFAARGVRTLGLVHFSVNAIASPAYGMGARPDRGLTGFGREAIAEMNRLGVIVDLAHINRTGFFEALAASADPVLVTHTGVSGVHPHWRNIDDEQLRAVGERGGAVGIIFAPRYLGGRSIEAVVDHIVHVIDVAGEDVPALGSDFDGFVIPPSGLEDASMLPQLTCALAARGLDRRALEKVLGGNALRVLDAVPARAAGAAGGADRA
jgi:membrane dipeptidase